MNVNDIQPRAAANVTPQIIEAWKAAHGQIFEINAEGFKGWVRKPKRADMKYITSKARTSDPITVAEITLDQLWLGGDDEIKENDELFYAVSQALESIVESKVADLKKL